MNDISKPVTGSRFPTPFWKTLWRHNSTADDPIWIEIRSSTEYDMPMKTKGRNRQLLSKILKAALFLKIRSNYISAVDWGLVWIWFAHRYWSSWMESGLTTSNSKLKVDLRGHRSMTHTKRKNNFVTSRVVYIIKTACYFHSHSLDKINFAILYVTERWALHMQRAVIKRQLFSSAGWAYQIRWSNAACVCVCVFLDVNQGGTNRNRCTLVILHAQPYSAVTDLRSPTLHRR